MKKATPTTKQAASKSTVQKKTSSKPSSTTKQSNKQSTTTKNQVQNKQPEKQKQASIPEVKIAEEVPLTQIVQVIERLTKEDKTAFFIDPKGQAHVFFKYKGSVSIMNDHWEKEMMLKTGQDEGVEDARKTIVGTLGSGSMAAFAFNKAQNLDEYMKSGKPYNNWWQPEIIFNHKEIQKEDYYKKQLLKEEEDKDIFGDKGNYIARNEFSLSLIYHQQEEEKDIPLGEIFQKLGLDPQLFTIIKLNY